MELEVKIRKKLGGFRMDMEFQAKAGRTGILGASGCGKSMTLKAIAGIVTPDEGRIVLNGSRTSRQASGAGTLEEGRRGRSASRR